MPHLSIEYSAGLEGRADVALLCKRLYETMAANAIFPLAGIRVRAFRADHAIVADALDENDFAALTLNVGAGRTVDVLKAAGDELFAVAREVLKEPLATTHFALSLQIRVADPELSWKDTPIHARLSGRK